ncbi:MAG: DUF4062 domain-containing protein [Verrucomicrobiaceae bacterium]|nr:DUF4062 domain-containing protein [Verrucomicrobiaceae bacterium]
MNRTRIFVSSTCYDLGPVRENLRELILSLGHEPVLSEYASFPVNPSESAIANCRRNVKEKTDVLVLIVGGSRGTLDVHSGKPIVNLEFEEAVAAGLPVFVFVRKSVMTLLPHWKNSANWQFTRDVDGPEVFEFVERLRGEGRWIFEFDRTDEIKTVLSVQLSNLLRDLLDRSSAGTLDPLAEFGSESREAERIAREKPKYWEFFLIAELVRTKLKSVRLRYDRLAGGFVHIRGERMRGKQFIEDIQDLFADVLAIAEAMRKQFAISLQESMGPLGKPGNASEIKTAVDGLIDLFNNLIDCEERLHAMRPPEIMEAARDALKGIAEVPLKEFEQFPEQFLKPFENGNDPTGVLKLTVTFGEPDFERFKMEMEKLNRAMETHPALFREIL